jgi:hypothetical protein
VEIPTAKSAERAPDDDGFRLTPEERACLEASIAQAERGEVVDGWRLLDELALSPPP